MNLELFIAKRIHFGTDGTVQKVSPPAIRIATAGVALGLAVMILAVAIVVGFKKEIRAKIIGFSSHIQIAARDNNFSYETHPVSFSAGLLDSLRSCPDIKQLSAYATKPGILKTDDSFLGVALKGVSPDYDWDFFAAHLQEGVLPQLSDTTLSTDILVSRYIADKLHLSVDDPIMCYFVQDNIRARKFRVSGIYQTNFTDYDKLFIIGDAGQVQRLNGWAGDQYSGLEIQLHRFDDVERMRDELYFRFMGQPDPYGEYYYVSSVKEQHPQIFSWLELLDLNVWVILILMSLVAGFTMISGLLIIILERTNMIGVLKALGASNFSIRRVFLYVSVFLVGKGMLWGNVIGIGLC
ncbi:MAG: ABC transporter permease, partial [Coprobacter sp.]|nr:ABC transporter permease [Coprobacter sp.]